MELTLTCKDKEPKAQKLATKEYRNTFIFANEEILDHSYSKFSIPKLQLVYE